VRVLYWLALAVAWLGGSIGFDGLARAASPGTLRVDVSKPGAPIGKLFYGLMTEEINHSYDGGLYAELIQNRIFQNSPAEPVDWSIVQAGKSAGTIELDPTNPVNDTALKTSLKLKISALDNGGHVGVANSGYWGIPVWPNTKYHASFYARSTYRFDRKQRWRNRLRRRQGGQYFR
jgi:alpha-N-arabinofuranosidase